VVRACRIQHLPQGAAKTDLMQPTATSSRTRWRSAIRVAAPLLLIFLLGGCMLPPEPKTEAAKDVFNLYLLVLALAVIVFVGVEGFLVYAIVRYRRKPGDDTLPKQYHGNNKIEIVWTAIPTIIVFVLFTFSMITLAEVDAKSDHPGAVIEVDGFQWQWTFRYSNGAVVNGSAAKLPVLAVPVGEPVRLILKSLDVNHAFFVPDFLIKRDLIDFGEGIPPNELEFTVTEAGTYSGQCAEFCGAGHADMRFSVQAMARADYDAYIAGLLAAVPSASPADCGTTIKLAAVQSLKFDPQSLSAPAGESFCIEFTNNDTVVHDVGIGAIEFDGTDVQPGETFTYVIPAMDAGDYEFHCNIHPTMTGTLTVGS